MNCKPHYISLPHYHTSHPHSFIWRSNREQGVTREKQLPQKLHRLLPMATMKKQQHLRRRPHILPGGLERIWRPHSDACVQEGYTGRLNCEETGVVCRMYLHYCVFPFVFVCIHQTIITHLHHGIAQWCFVRSFSFGLWLASFLGSPCTASNRKSWQPDNLQASKLIHMLQVSLYNNTNPIIAQINIMSIQISLKQSWFSAHKFRVKVNGWYVY